MNKLMLTTAYYSAFNIATKEWVVGKADVNVYDLKNAEQFVSEVLLMIHKDIHEKGVFVSKISLISKSNYDLLSFVKERETTNGQR